MNCTSLARLSLLLALFTPVAATHARINELSIAADSQYFEIRGPAGLDVSPFHYLVIGDGEDGDSGVIETVIPLQGVVPDDGFYLAAESRFRPRRNIDLMTDLNFEHDDNVTHLVVGGFTGAVRMDLDTNDDCHIDVEVPWGPVIDGIALVKEPNPPQTTECHYGGNALGDGLEFPVVGSGELPSHLSAIPDGSDNYHAGTGTGGDQNSFYVYDDFADGSIDDLSPVSWVIGSGNVTTIENGNLRLASFDARGGRVTTESGDLPARDAWSLRARMTLNEVLGAGIAGVGVNDARWTSVFGRDRFGVGEWDVSTTAPVEDVLGEEYIVQFRATSEKLEGYFWLPDSPGDIISVERQNLEGGEFAPRLAMVGSDATYHEIWISTEPFPLTMPGTSFFADVDGDGDLDSNDINLLSELVRDESDRLIYDVEGSGTLDQEDRRVWVEDAFGTDFGDTNLDKKVDFADFLNLTANFGSTGGWIEGDFDGDGWIRFEDFLLLSENFSGSSQTASVPEPSAGLLAWLALVGIACHCRSLRVRQELPISTR